MTKTKFPGTEQILKAASRSLERLLIKKHKAKIRDTRDKSTTRISKANPRGRD